MKCRLGKTNGGKNGLFNALVYSKIMIEINGQFLSIVTKYRTMEPHIAKYDAILSDKRSQLIIFL